ncbi:MAG: tetratricopeptide repeat protein [SAR86 cluster bacterium]|jgi:tetratricopeptide (TPR) repeat protein|nr:tetratricopeptide repeat protein [SAR86 cluster bacterium]
MEKFIDRILKNKLFFLLLIFSNSLSSAVTVIGNSDAAICYRYADTGSSSKTSISICRDVLSDKNVPDDLLAATRVNLGIIYNNALRPQEAINEFNLAKLNEAAKPEAILNQGNSFYLLKNFSLALEKYKSSLAHNIKDISAVFFNMGLAYEQIGDNDKAIRNYQKAIDIKPDTFIYLQARARLVEQGLWNLKEG